MDQNNNMARYFTPTPQQYISQFVPPNLELMYKVGQERAAQDALVTDALDKAKSELQVQGGMFTDKEKATQVNENINSNINAITDAFYSGKVDSFQAARAIIRLQTEVKNNKEYKLYKLDEAYTKAMAPEIAKGKFNNALGVVRNGVNVIDARNGLKVNYKIDPDSETEESLAEAYNWAGAGEFEKEHAHFTQQASIPKIISAMEKAGYGVDNSNPNMPVFYNYKEREKITGITKDVVKEYAKQYANMEWDNTTDKPSVEYMRRAGESKEDYVNRLTNLIMPGVTNIDITKERHGSPLTSDKQSPNTDPNFYPTPAEPTKRGIENASTLGKNFNEFMKGRRILTNEEIYDITAGGALPEALPKDGIIEYKWSDIPQEQKNIIAHYFRMRGGSYEKYAKDIESGKDMSWLKSNKSNIGKELQKDLNNPQFIKRMELIDVASNNTVYDLQYGAEELYGVTGVKQSSTSPPTLSDFLGAEFSNMKAYDINNNAIIPSGKFRELPIYKEYTSEDKKNTTVGITKYTPDNNLRISIGDGDTWHDAFKVTIDGNSYVFQAPRKPGKQAEQLRNQQEAINELYNRLTFSLPGTEVKWGNKKFYYDDERRDGKKVYMDAEGNEYETIYDVFKLTPTN